MRKKNIAYEQFTFKLKRLQQATGRSHWNPIKFQTIDPLISVWDSMSKRKKINLLKDSRWNHYPLASYTSTSPKKYGSAIQEFVLRLLDKGGDDKSILESHSVGVFAIHAIDNSSSSVRRKMAKRLRSSKDTRLRTRSVKILPISSMPYFLKDPCYRVRSHAITRLGFDNCYKEFLPSDDSEPKDRERWWFNWFQTKAVRLAEVNEVESLMPILSEDNPEEKLNPRTIEALLKKIPREDIIFYLQNSKLSPRAEKIISRKLS